MHKTIVSLLLSFVLGGTLLAGLLLGKRGTTACPTCPLLAGDMTAAQQTLAALHEELAALREDFRSYRAESRTQAREIAAAESPSTGPAPPQTSPTAVAALTSIKASVLMALAEDREQREAQRQEERDTAREAAEKRRQEREALQSGPYEKLNLKVNSLGNVLQLTEAQKQSYHGAVQGARDRLKEAMKQPGAATGAEGQTAEGGRGRGREAWGKLRELRETVQAELEQDLSTIFTPAQLETYGQLSRSDRDFQDLGEVRPPGESGGGERRQVQPGFPGAGGNRSGSGGRARGGPGSGGW